MTITKPHLSGGDLIQLIEDKPDYEIQIQSIALKQFVVDRKAALSQIDWRKDYQCTVSDEKRYIGIWVSVPRSER